MSLQCSYSCTLRKLLVFRAIHTQSAGGSAAGAATATSASGASASAIHGPPTRTRDRGASVATSRTRSTTSSTATAAVNPVRSRPQRASMLSCCLTRSVAHRGCRRRVHGLQLASFVESPELSDGEIDPPRPQEAGRRAGQRSTMRAIAAAIYSDDDDDSEDYDEDDDEDNEDDDVDGDGRHEECPADSSDEEEAVPHFRSRKSRGRLAAGGTDVSDGSAGDAASGGRERTGSNNSTTPSAAVLAGPGFARVRSVGMAARQRRRRAGVDRHMAMNLTMVARSDHLWDARPDCVQSLCVGKMGPPPLLLATRARPRLLSSPPSPRARRRCSASTAWRPR